MGGIAVDAEVPSLIHYLGGDAVDNTKVSEDYIVYTDDEDYSDQVAQKQEITGVKNVYKVKYSKLKKGTVTLNLTAHTKTKLHVYNETFCEGIKVKKTSEEKGTYNIRIKIKIK